MNRPKYSRARCIGLCIAATILLVANLMPRTVPPSASGFMAALNVALLQPHGEIAVYIEDGLAQQHGWPFAVVLWVPLLDTGSWHYGLATLNVGLLGCLLFALDLAMVRLLRLIEAVLAHRRK